MTALAAHAVALAEAGWSVFPLQPRGKTPLTTHGFKDATSDVVETERRWRTHPRANIGAVVPTGVVVLDIDPRNGGGESLHALKEKYGPLPVTLASRTGGGGWHVFYAFAGDARQGSHRLGDGIDVKVAGRGYVVMPPSIHPSGRSYAWFTPEAPVAALPPSVAAALQPPATRPAPQVIVERRERPGDAFNAATTWEDVLCRVGWVRVYERGDTAYWRRPGKTDGISATTNALGTDRLHVFTSGAGPLEQERSYDRFGAYAALHFHGDLAAAASALRVAS